MRPTQKAIFRGPAAQFFYGIIALTLVSFALFGLASHQTKKTDVDNFSAGSYPPDPV
jgi:hypothetical protein